MMLNQKRRVEKIERALKIGKGKTRLFPDGKGGFIELPTPEFYRFSRYVRRLGKKQKTERK